MKSTRVCLICVIILFIILSVLLHIIALATEFWLKSSDDNQINFLNIGLWTACFDGYTHRHENPTKLYQGCHSIESDYYESIQDWLFPGAL